jgi:hypothetical protein
MLLRETRRDCRNAIPFDQYIAVNGLSRCRPMQQRRAAACCASIVALELTRAICRWIVPQRRSARMRAPHAHERDSSGETFATCKDRKHTRAFCELVIALGHHGLYTQHTCNEADRVSILRKLRGAPPLSPTDIGRWRVARYFDNSKQRKP